MLLHKLSKRTQHTLLSLATLSFLAACFEDPREKAQRERQKNAQIIAKAAQGIRAKKEEERKEKERFKKALEANPELSQLLDKMVANKKMREAEVENGKAEFYRAFATESSPKVDSGPSVGLIVTDQYTPEQKRYFAEFERTSAITRAETEKYHEEKRQRDLEFVRQQAANRELTQRYKAEQAAKDANRSSRPSGPSAVSRQ